MGISCYLNSPAPLSGDELSTLTRALAPLADALPWGCEAFSLEGAVQVDGLFVATKIQNEDGDAMWRDLMQCLALGLVASRALPERLFQFEDDLDLVGVEIGRVALRGGKALDEGVDARMREALAAQVDAGLFGVERPERVSPLSREKRPRELQGELVELRWPPEDHSPAAWTNRPSVQALHLVQEPPDGDGDLKIELEAELLNGDDVAAAALGIVVRVLDDEGALVAVLEDSEGPCAPGGTALVSDTAWVKEGTIARAEVWVTRAERSEQAVEPEVFWRGPDDEGDHRADLHLKWHLASPASALLRVRWEGGEEDELELDGLGVGHQLLQFSCYQFAADEEQKAGQACRATLVLERVHTWEGPSLPQSAGPQLPVPMETVEAEPADPVQVADDAGPWERVLAGDIDGALERLEDLDSEGRDSVRRLIQSDRADDVVAGLRIARHCNWRSAVTMARRHLHHDDASVREQACLACGELGGPSLVIPLRALLRDPEPRVRRAADTAIATIEG